MAEENEIKVSKSYSLDPAVIVWIARTAMQMSMDNLKKGEGRVSDSELVNTILTAVMDEGFPLERLLGREETKRKTNPRMRAVAA